MDINIIAGSFGELNNEYIFSLLRKRDKSKNHIIIVPDRCQFSIEQRIFEETGEKCFFDINVISLSRLTKKVVKNNNKKILSKQSGVALVRKILHDKKDDLLVFNKATEFIGFASSLFETICFYKSCRVTPEDMFIDESNTFANLKQKDIKLVYSEYEKYLQNEYTDSFNQLKVFADTIDNQTFSNTIFYILEFDDFTQVMYEIIYKISKFSDGMYITCSYGKGNNNSNIFNNKVYYDLIDLYKSQNLEFKINTLKCNNEDRMHLSQNLLSYTPVQSTQACNNIVIKQFDNLNDEVKFIIADIYSKLILENENLSQFALVVPSLDDYMTSIMQELKKYNLNCYFDKSEKLIDNYIIRLVFSICDIISGDYRLSDFSVAIKSPLLNFDASAVCEYDNYLKRIGAVSDMCLRPDKTDNSELIEFIDFIKKIRANVREIEFGSDCVDIILSIFNYVNIRAEYFVSNLDDLQKRTFDQVLNKFNNINKDYLGVLGGSKVNSFSEFIDVYKEYFDSTNISMPPISSNTLFVADFNASYLSKYDYIYILGNNDGKLPSQKLDNGIVTDEELSRLPNAKKLTPTIAMLNARKVIKLYELCFKFKKQLHLSYLLGNMEGKLYPNNLIESLNNIYDFSSVENYSGVLDVVNRNYNELDINNIVFNNLTPKMMEDNLIGYLTNWSVFNNNLNYRELCSSLYQLSSSNTQDVIKNISKDTRLETLSSSNFFKSKRTSISQIETFNRCPYMHFVKYGLKLKETQDTRLKPIDIGNIIHEVLSRVVPLIVKGNTLEDVKAKAQNILKDVLSKENYLEIIENKNNAYVIKSLYREMDRVVDAVVNEIACSNFVPKYYEFKFDNVLQICDINIKGFIDRIDVKDDGFIILDYKTGDNQFKNFNDVVSGKKLQLLVYAKAFEKFSGLDAKGVFYFPIMNGFDQDNMYTHNGVMLKSEDNIMDMDSGLIQESYKSKSIHLQTTSKGKIKESQYYKNMCLSREDFDYLLNFAIKQVEKSISNIIRGEISPYPLNEKGKCVCEYCDYKALCNYNNKNDHVVENIEDINKLKEKGI